MAASPTDEHTGIVTARSRSTRAFAWTVGGLCVLAFVTLMPLGAPLLLAAWMAIVVEPLCSRITKRVHQKRRRVAALLSVAMVLLVLAPFLITVLSLSASAVELFNQLQQSKTSTGALAVLTQGKGFDLASLNPQQIVDWLRAHAGGAVNAARMMFGAATTAVVGLVVFVGAFFAFLADGARIYQWLLERSPLSRPTSTRFAAVFAETGRGLLIGVGLTALLQAAVATVGYVVTGVPQAFVLGVITIFASLIPSVGAALVWAPVAAGLALDGRMGAAAILLAIGLFVSVVDNLVRPALSRYGKLELPSFVLFIAMLGGIAAFGTVGIFIGPLFVRLAVEGLDLDRARRTAPV